MKVGPLWCVKYAAWKAKNRNLDEAGRGDFVRGCIGKAAIPSIIVALKHASSLPLRKGYIPQVYVCDICEFFHIGNQKIKKAHLDAIMGKSND